MARGFAGAFWLCHVSLVVAAGRFELGSDPESKFAMDYRTPRE